MTAASPAAGASTPGGLATVDLSGARVVRATTGSRIGTSLAIAAVVGLAVVPFVAERTVQITLIELLYYLALAQMWNLLAGSSGLLSIGQQGFVGVAAYGLFFFAESHRVPMLAAVLLAGVAALVVAVPAAAVAFRLRGGYFAVGTWVIAEMLRLITLRIEALGAGDVQSFTTTNTFRGLGVDARIDLVYWLALFVGAGATALAVIVLRSRLGLGLQASADSEGAAAALGVDVTCARLTIWLLAAFWTGLTGAVIHLNSSNVTNQNAFSVLDWTAIVIFIVVVGGKASVAGPIIGVGVYWAIAELIDDATTWRFIVLGTLAVVVAVVEPAGLFGALRRWRPIEPFPIRRSLRTPTTAPTTAHPSPDPTRGA
ncbi:MAG: branched-chain amino acid ABC transporter permease [Acidimicrobiales bacterium]